LAATAVVIALAALWWFRPPEPRAGGRPLRAWLAELNDPQAPRRQAAVAAVREIGTNAIPHLLGLIQSRESEFRRGIINRINRQATGKLVTSARERREQAARAFRVLGPQAASAVPQLRILVQDPVLAPDVALALSGLGETGALVLQASLRHRHPQVRTAAAAALGWVQPAQQSAAALALLPTLNDGETDVRYRSVVSLGRLARHPDQVVPALAQRLQDAEPLVRRLAVAALGAFGSDARPALPSLEAAAKDPDPDVQAAARTLLGKLAPPASP
jgi:HEAT repeat protein